ncbi:MAG: LysM peptidoglycan-binding domain-containing M23 family metallopeptidase [Patescibacteria group bacterium]|nr:LysM peptidoglycan-binding domain-containing M23 family metallopeptidase [Patescibacteria group bacterium]
MKDKINSDEDFSSMRKYKQNIEHKTNFHNSFKRHQRLFVPIGIVMFIIAGNILIGNVQGIFYNLSESDNYTREKSLLSDNSAGETVSEKQEKKEPLVHEVKSGDTIWGITEEHNIKKEAVLEVNNLTDKSILKIGQEIILPSKGELIADLNSEKIDFKSQAALLDDNFFKDEKNNLEDNDRSENKPFNYEVVSGDTVSGIAEKYNLKINTILWANNLTVKSIIKPGQIIILLPTDGVLHEIIKGETIGQIALMHKAEVQETIDYNDIGDSAKIYPGDQIIIPGGEPLLPSKPKIASIPKPSVGVVDNQLLQKVSSVQNINGKLLWPTSARTITQGYGPNHRGIDIANGGTPPIFASHNGTVEFVGNQGDWGNTILLRRDDGLVTRYSHASEMYVIKDQKVNAGNTIGRVGNTGRVRGRTGLHLDFRVYKKGVVVNPFNYLK